MKKFSFSYERAMDWRDKRAEKERQELARLNNLHSELDAARRELADRIADSGRALAGETSVTASDLRNTAVFVRALKLSDSGLQKQQSACRTDIEVQTQRCIEAERDYKLLARLREKRLDAWTYEYNREAEQTASDVWQAGQTRLSIAARGMEYDS